MNPSHPSPQDDPMRSGTCAANYFVISQDAGPGRLRLLFERVARAHATQESIIIGYAGAGDCAHGYIRVYRVG